MSIHAVKNMRVLPPVLVIIATCCFLVLYLNADMVKTSLIMAITAYKHQIETTEIDNNGTFSEPEDEINNKTVKMEAATVPEGEMSNETDTADEPNSMPHKNNICTWRPGSDQECLELLSTGLRRSAHQWKLFGDSTMSRTYKAFRSVNSRNPQLWKSCQCQSKLSGRCDMAWAFGFEKHEPWIPPNISKGEGPVLFGLEHPHCTDCSGCQTNFVECKVSCPHLATASYFSVEFARDVEIQTQFANTTQENLALYLRRQRQAMATSNQTASHENDKSSGTVCVINTGIHDVLLNLTVDAYVKNVRWYLELLYPAVCPFIIWLYTTAPQTENFAQKTSIFKEWNEAVAEMLAGHIELSWSCFVIDLYEASRVWPHADNVHLEGDFYAALGSLLSRL